MNRRAGTELKASLVKDTKDTQVLLLESRRTGAANGLEFRDKARDFAIAVGLVMPTDSRGATLDIRQGAVQASAIVPSSAPPPVAVEGGELTLRPGGKARLPVSPPLALDSNMVLELELRTVSLEQKPWTPPPPPPGPDLPPGAQLEFRGIPLHNAPSRMPIPGYTPPRAPETVEDMAVLSAESRGKPIALPALTASPQWRRIQIPIGELADSVEAIVAENRNSYREIGIRNARIYDVTSRGDTRPLNALSQAGDAELTIDGVTATRDTNSVDDLIPGVTVSLKAASEEPVTLTVAPNTELIKEKIITFVGRYNKALTDVDVLTRRDETIVASAYYASEEERTAAAERLGLLAGDMTLSRLRTQLSTIMMNAYRTGAGQELALLAQMGIATNTQGAGSGTLDRTRLRGYLDIDEAKLDRTLTEKLPAAKELFGRDTDGDLVIDSGVAYETERTLRAYVGRGGVIAQRITTLDTQISQKNTQIDRENVRLADTESELKQKYATMEGALQSLQESSQRLENFNQANR